RVAAVSLGDCHRHDRRIHGFSAGAHHHARGRTPGCSRRPPADRIADPPDLAPAVPGRTVNCGCRFGVRPGTLAAVGRDHQPLLPVALRHDAGVRSRHAAGRGGVRGDRDPARCFGYRRRIVGAAAAQWPAAGPSMNAMGFAWRSLVRQPARASLGVLGVAAVGALLFDMLLLSNGLVVSMRGLLERTGFDLRVTATDALPGSGPLIPDAVAVTEAISKLPSVRSAV